MTLSAGSRIGPYEIVEAIGAGGMGEVYRARDAKLARDVAIKVLPSEFALDPDRLARFTREAQVLASLSHQNIAGIYGFEESRSGGSSDPPITALVLEFVDGPTLADRIAQGAIPVDEALPIARQIAEALEAAHEQGIIHRDLKPANIKVRPDGTVKVLDFGLAKLIGPPEGGPYVHELGAGFSRPGATASPTITTPAMTMAGVILGTAAYMSPEQAKGRPADKRSDLWAFGCVLYEMLAGRRAFDGDDVSDTLAFVLTKQPDLNALPAVTPRAVRTLLRRCLEKDRKRRLADAADARLEIEDAITRKEEIVAIGSPPDTRARWRSMWLAAGAVVAGGAIVGGVMSTRRPPPHVTPVTRFTIPLPEGQRFTENGLQVLAISPDGSRIVYVANRRLFLRSLSDLESKPIAGTEVQLGQSNDPVFSPDGNSIAYLAGRPASIKRVAITGGAPVTICEGCIPSGVMSWDADGIVFGQGGANSPTSILNTRPDARTNSIVRIPADGGTPKVLFNVTGGFPWNVQTLPGGKAVLFGFVEGDGILNRPGGASFDRSQAVLQTLSNGAHKAIAQATAGVRYVPSGHIVYAREGILFARRFDLARAEVVGEEVPVVEGVRRPILLGGSSPSTPYFDVSPTGTLAYVPAAATSTVLTDLALIDQKSGTTLLKLPPRLYQFPRLSPDGKRVAVEVDDANTSNVWIYDLSGASSIRQLTFGGNNKYPIWSADGRWVAFQSDREGDLAIYQQPADGGAAMRLTKAGANIDHIPDAWSADGRNILFEEHKDGRYTLRSLSMADGKISNIGDIQGSLYLNVALSPDGRWIAYRTSSGGASAVSVQPLPPTGAKYLIGNGVHPVWSHDGKTLYFRQLTTQELTATQINTQSGFSFTTPEILSVNFPDRSSNATLRNHDILPDGRFVGVVLTGSQSGPDRINVVLNWFEELKQKLPPIEH